MADRKVKTKKDDRPELSMTEALRRMRLGQVFGTQRKVEAEIAGEETPEERKRRIREQQRKTMQNI